MSKIGTSVPTFPGEFSLNREIGVCSLEAQRELPNEAATTHCEERSLLPSTLFGDASSIVMTHAVLKTARRPAKARRRG